MATKTVYKREGYDSKKQGYIVWEYENGSPVYQYTGYDKGTYMDLYPHHALVKGTRREKRRVSIYELEA
ncbi:MAG: hypothetical protein IKC26_10020 [Clostridia bacterium]|nr:hypothetical protein [Clostridia bacterium]MBR2908358.1 hypothetical protein [Clostridia bacterium]